MSNNELLAKFPPFNTNMFNHNLGFPSWFRSSNPSFEWCKEFIKITYDWFSKIRLEHSEIFKINKSSEEAINSYRYIQEILFDADNTYRKYRQQLIRRLTIEKSSKAHSGEISELIRVILDIDNLISIMNSNVSYIITALKFSQKTGECN